jgi:hypothetical protein
MLLGGREDVARMPGEEVWAALAATGGTAVVQAAGKDTWESVRDRVVKMLGRGRASHAQWVRARLDETAAELEADTPDGIKQVQSRLAAAWEARFEMLLEELEGIEREEVGGQLREVVAFAAASPSGVSAGAAVGGHNIFHAAGGSVAAGIVHGGVRIANPLRPGADQS